MKITSLSLTLIISVLCLPAYAVTSSGYNICPRVSTGFLAAISTDRTIVVNYHPGTGYFVVLRCGQEQRRPPSAEGVDNDCHVYRASSYAQLCRRERAMYKVTKLLADVMEKVPAAVVTGGVSALTQAQVVAQSLRTSGLQPECLGVSLLKALAINKNVDVLLESYYNAQVDLAPFTGVARVLNGTNSSSRNAWIFNSLDGLLVGGNGSRSKRANERQETSDIVILKGPAHLIVRRNTRTVTLLVNEDERASLCVQFPHIN